MLRNHSLNIVKDVAEVADNRNFNEVFDEVLPLGSDVGCERMRHTEKNSKGIGAMAAFTSFLNSVRNANNSCVPQTVMKRDTVKGSPTYGDDIEVPNLKYNPNLFQIESAIETYVLVSKGKVSVEQKLIERFAKDVSFAIGFRDYPTDENIGYAFARLAEVFERTNLFISAEITNSLNAEIAEAAMAAAL